MRVIPFSFLPYRMLVSTSDKFMGWGETFNRFFPNLQLELDRADINIESKRYIAMCLVSIVFQFILLSVVLTAFLLKIQYYFTGVIAASALSVLVFIMQLNYPKVRANVRIRALEADLLSSLRAIMIQLNSGVPLFDALVIISKQGFGEVSLEFSKGVKQINAGVSQINALETMALKNPSPYFRRAIWQLINGMKEGASITVVMESVINHLTKEQIIQIEKYGSQLSPLSMFYMIGAVILPALAITFFVVISAFIQMDPLFVKLILWGILAFVTFFQIMISGIIKTKRPSLLGE